MEVCLNSQTATAPVSACYEEAASSALIAPDRPPPSRPAARPNGAGDRKAAMTPDLTDLREEILGLQGPLQVYASRLSEDDEEARDLFHFAMRTALDGGARPPEGHDTKLWLFGLMRQAFHSVARRRAASRERGAAGQQWRADRAEVFVLAAKASALPNPR
jgi:DNA-directed RNA polymerase specialized sigma24 family protein